MGEKKIYEIINPSDQITVRATPEEASVLGVILGASFYFLKDAETNEDAPKVSDDEWKELREAIYADAERRKSYADVFRSALIGSMTDRLLFEDAVAKMTPADAKAYLDKWQDMRRSSMNDICKRLRDAADGIENWKTKEEAA